MTSGLDAADHQELDFCHVLSVNVLLSQLVSLVALLAFSGGNPLHRPEVLGLDLTDPRYLSFLGVCLALSVLHAKLKIRALCNKRLPSGGSSARSDLASSARSTRLRRIVQTLKLYGRRFGVPLKLAVKGALHLLAFYSLVTYVVFCFGAPIDFLAPLLDSNRTLAFCLLLTLNSGFLTILVHLDHVGGEVPKAGCQGILQVLTSGAASLDGLNRVGEPDPLGNQLFVGFAGAALGAWFGAFPIPLDWDRPWQVWPITCSIGVAVGSLLASILNFLVSRNLSCRANSWPSSLPSIAGTKVKRS